MGVSYGRGNGFVVAKNHNAQKDCADGSKRGRRHHVAKVQEPSIDDRRVQWTAPSYFNVVVGGGTSGIEWSECPRLWNVHASEVLPSCQTSGVLCASSWFAWHLEVGGAGCHLWIRPLPCLTLAYLAASGSKQQVLS